MPKSGSKKQKIANNVSKKVNVKTGIVVKKQPKNESKKERNIRISEENKNAIESMPLELENGEGNVENTKFTEVQLKRKVQCRTMEGKIIEVPWYLMTQSQIFAEMWTNLGQENEVAKEESNTPLIFNLPTIGKKCFRRIVNWMRHRHGQSEFELKIGKETGQQIWFQPDEWECNFGFGGGKNKMNLEAVKDLYLAANFLDLPSLFHYCVQEFAFAVIQANKLEQVREILCLVDDLTEEEKKAIYQEFDIPVPVPKEKMLNYWEQTQILGSNYWEKNKIVGKIQNPLPPELVHPILAKLSLSDQRWLLPMNRDAYKYLAERVRKNWPKWMDTLNVFFVDVSPNWNYGHPVVHIPSLQYGQPAFQWTASHFLAYRSLQTEMLITQNFIEHQINSINAEPIATEDQMEKLWRENCKKKQINSILSRAIEHMEALLGRGERMLQQKMEEISKLYEDMTSMNSYKRGLIHLVEQRRQILEELEANEMKELKKKLADSEKGINEYWVHRL